MGVLRQTIYKTHYLLTELYGRISPAICIYIVLLWYLYTYTCIHYIQLCYTYLLYRALYNVNWCIVDVCRES